MKISELKLKPKELPCCKNCEHFKKAGFDNCLKPLVCVDILIHNDLIDINTLMISD